MTGMQISTERPPVWDQCVATFGERAIRGAVFAWGDTIYAPDNAHKTLTEDLIVHEMVHRRQQQFAGGPEAWWARYLTDADFRLNQEVEAYRAQIAFLPSREWRRAAKKAFARQLASPMYRLPITESEARALLSMAHVVGEAA